MVVRLVPLSSDRLYNYSYVLPFEEKYSPVPETVWIQDHWYHSVTLSLIYVAVIYVGKKIMSKRSAFDLESLLTAWNAFLAVFSILGALRVSPEFFYVLRNQGFQQSICTAGYAQLVVTGFWTEMFAASKAFELIDTVFIILRKRPLMFLHWYHHLTVLIYTWHAYKEHTAAGRWFIWMNFHVHAFMYSYYALRSLGWRFPKWMAMCLTGMQIVQMIIGCSIGIIAYRTKASGQFCQQTFQNLYFSFGIYFTYFLLFANFFYNVYLKKGNRYQQQKKKVPKEHENGHVQNGNISTEHANGSATAAPTEGKKVQ